MLMKDCVKSAAFLLQLVDAEQYADSYIEGGKEPDESVKTDIDLMIKCGNLVLNEIASDWVYLKKTEKISAKDKTVNFDDLSEKIIDVFGVNFDGSECRYKRYFDRLEFEKEGEVELTYSYAPAFCPLNGEILFGERVSPRAIAYGIACEYCLITGRSDDAVMWDNRFRDALKSAVTVKRNLRLPRRKWL